jgi:hypothetical protein
MKHLRPPDTIIEHKPALTDLKPPRANFISEFAAALPNSTRHQRLSVPKPKPELNKQVRYVAKPWTAGIVLMTAASWGMTTLGIFDLPGTAPLVYLAIIILLSLMVSFITSAIFSPIAVSCLDYFFMVLARGTTRAGRFGRSNVSGERIERRLAATARPLPQKPSIAVLPFANMSGDAEQEYFSEGIIRSIATKACRLSKSLVCGA